MQTPGELKKPLQAGTLRKDQPRLCCCPGRRCPIHGLPQFRGK